MTNLEMGQGTWNFSYSPDYKLLFCRVSSMTLCSLSAGFTPLPQIASNFPEIPGEKGIGSGIN